MDYRIEQFADYIKRIDTESQTTSVEQIPNKWTIHYDRFPWLQEILESIESNGEYKLSRRDIFNTQDKRERVVKTIFWGFPKAYRSNETLESILESIDNITKALHNYGRILTQEEYISLFNNLRRIGGMQESTISKLLCFWRIRVASSEAIIVDQFVRESSHIFEQLWGTSLLYPYSAEDNLFVVKKINSIARSMKVRPQQLEYFLFITGKIAKSNRLTLFKQLLQLAGGNVLEDYNHKE